MVRIFGSTGSRRRHRYQFAAILSLVALLGALAALPAQAIHNAGDTSLELDGNVRDNPTGAPDDWNNFFPTPPPNSSTFFTTGIVPDPEPETIFTGAQSGGSSKDNQDISGWRWKCGSVPPKDEIADAASAIYTIGAEQRLYFMADREAVTGSSHIGVWFFKKTVTAAGACDGAQVFSDGVAVPPTHSVGDILVLSDFTQGGAISNIKVFRWVGTGGTEPKSNGTMDRIGLGTDCIGLVHNPGDPELCGTVNSTLLGPGVDGPAWPYTPKSGANGSYPPGSFFEGGIDLGSLGLTGQCFGSVLTETRSSAEIDAVLKDFVVHGFEACGSTTKTTPQDSSGNPITGDLSIGTGSVQVQDLAEVSVTGANTDPTGTVKFFLCGPIASGNCATGGTQVGAPAAGETLVGGTPNDGKATATSDLVTVTSVGRFCFRAEYSGDGLYPPSKDPPGPDGTDANSECFTVTPVTPDLTTTAGDDVTLGNPVTDTASLTGTASQPTGPPPFNTDGTTGSPADGTITFTLYGPDDCTRVATGTGTNPQTVPVSGDGTYGPVSFTPDMVGGYTWVASYSGDSPNTNAVPDTACPSAPENVVVTGNAHLSTAQDWLPNDTATVTGDTALHGTLTFTLYHSTDCTGDPVVHSGFTNPETVNVPSGTTSGTEFSTSNTTFKVKASNAGDYSWKVSYDDQVLTDPPDECETSTVTITD